jgi:hypothetical protein
LKITNVWLGCVCLGLLAACGGGKKNRPPTTTGTSATLAEDAAPTPITVTSADPDGDTLTFAITANPARGTVTTSGPNQFIYTPAANQNGADQFAYTVTDPKGRTATGMVSITITPQPDPPTVTAQDFTLNEDAILNGQIVAADVDADVLTYGALSTPADGVFTITASTGAFTFTPNANFNGSRSFEVSVNDGSQTRTATMTLVVVPVNDGPEASSDGVRIPGVGPSLVDVLANDADIDGDPLTVTIEQAPFGATATVVGNQVQITPTVGGGGPTSLVYRIRDPAGESAVARLDVVMGAVRPLFYYTGDFNTPERRIRRHDFLTNVELDTPVPAGSRLERFATSANGEWLVYVTQEPAPIRHRLWLRNLVDLSTPVVEVTTPAGFFTSALELSADGMLLAFTNRVASTATPTVSQLIEPFAPVSVERPHFASNSRQLYYVELMSGGGRRIMRTDVTASGAVGAPTQMTADFMVAEGLGIDYRLTPDETRIVSLGLFMPPPMVGNSIKQYAYVTSTNGTLNDARLHPEYTSGVDGIGFVPAVTRDSQYAVYVGTLNGATQLYSSQLSAPGTALSLANSNNIDQIRPAGNSNTVFYSLFGGPWFRARADVAASGVVFAPVPMAPAPRVLEAAPDGTAVVFDAGAEVYATLDGQYATATRLGQSSGDMVGSMRYSPDSLSVVVLDATLSGARLFNPKAVGWEHTLNPGPANSIGCVVYAGQSC